MNGIDRDALELIQQTAREAAGAGGKCVRMELPGEPPGTYALVQPDGTFEVRRAEPAARKHSLHSVNEVAGFVIGAKERMPGLTPTVWFNEGGIVAVLDDGPDDHREERAEVGLAWSPEFALLREIGGIVGDPRSFGQKDLLRLLRTRFSECLGEAGQELIRLLRVLKFSDVAGGSSTVQTGRESLGRDIESEVRSELGELPEEIVLSVRVFDDPGIEVRHSIRCVLEVNPRAVTFELLPYVDQVQLAVDEQLAAIGVQLRNELGKADVPVYFGTP